MSTGMSTVKTSLVARVQRKLRASMSRLRPHQKAFAKLHHDLAGLSMIRKPALEFTWREVLRLIRADVPGHIVECGTWRGGCSSGMALVQRLVFGRVRGKVWMFDSFQGLADASARDGQAALDYQQNVNAPNYYDNCRASHAQVV